MRSRKKHEKDTNERKIDEKALLENIKASIDPILKSDYKTSDHISIGTRLKHLQDEVTNYLPPTVNKKCGAAITTDDTFGDLTFGRYRDARHVHFASTPIRPEVSNINLTTPPCASKEETIAESVLQNTMQTLAFGRYRDARHVHFASTPIRPEVSNINLTTPPCASKEETIAESVLQNTMQTLALEFK